MPRRGARLSGEQAGQKLAGPIRAGVFIALAALAGAGPSFAGAWNPAKGDGLVILKYEPASADKHIGSGPVDEAMPYELREDIVSVWGEYGLTDRLAVIAKTEWQDVKDAGTRFEGRGPLEVGLRYQAWRNDYSAVAVQVSYADDGDGRNAAWAEPGKGENETELRLLAGHSFGFWRHSFIEAQVARRWRDGLQDETRLELTAGVDFASDWTVLAQTYSGWVDAAGGAKSPRWTKAEIGVIRRMGPWGVQAGYRQTLEGYQIPRSGGPIVAIWRRF